MPIYEYYCPECNGRYSHLARRIGVPAPPCPRCGNVDVERLMSAAAVLHDQAVHDETLREQRAGLDEDDPKAIAQFLEQSGRLKDVEGVYGGEAYRELLARRRVGASDEDVEDLVDDLVADASQSLEQTQAGMTAGATLFSDEVQARLQHGHDQGHEHNHDHEHTGEHPSHTHSPRSAEDLGWA